MGAQATMSTVRGGPKGRVVIPQGVREAPGIREGDTLVVRIEDGHAIPETREALLRRVQERFAALPSGVSLSEELVRERRQDAAREERRAAEGT